MMDRIMTDMTGGINIHESLPVRIGHYNFKSKSQITVHSCCILLSTISKHGWASLSMGRATVFPVNPESRIGYCVTVAKISALQAKNMLQCDTFLADRVDIFVAGLLLELN